jgi:hypothetical protein
VAEQHGCDKLPDGERQFSPVLKLLAETTTQVVAAKGCLATSTMSGHGLSIATTGVARSFTVTVRDSFGNLRPTGSDFVLSASIVSDNLPSYTANVAQPTANRYRKRAARPLQRAHMCTSVYSASYTVFASTVASR